MTGRRLKRGEYRASLGHYYGTPKEVWGFRTRASAQSVPRLRPTFSPPIAACSSSRRICPTSQLRKVIRSLGAEHVIYNQWHAGLRVHRAYVTVHLDRARRVYLSKNRAVPARLLPGDFDKSLDQGRGGHRCTAIATATAARCAGARDRAAVVPVSQSAGAGVESAPHASHAARRMDRLRQRTQRRIAQQIRQSRRSQDGSRSRVRPQSGDRAGRLCAAVDAQAAGSASAALDVP